MNINSNREMKNKNDRRKKCFTGNERSTQNCRMEIAMQKKAAGIQNRV